MAILSVRPSVVRNIQVIRFTNLLLLSNLSQKINGVSSHLQSAWVLSLPVVPKARGMVHSSEILDFLFMFHFLAFSISLSNSRS